jgi:hypothetical protein
VSYGGRSEGRGELTDGVISGWKEELFEMRESWWPFVGSCLESVIGELTWFARFVGSEEVEPHLPFVHRRQSLSSMEAERYPGRLRRLVSRRLERSCAPSQHILFPPSDRSLTADFILQDARGNHKITHDGYNVGRDLIVEKATGGTSYRGRTWETSVVYVEGLLPAGSEGSSTLCFLLIGAALTV